MFPAIKFNVKKGKRLNTEVIKMDKSTLYKLSYGLYAIGVQKGACIVNTVFQITSSPEVIALSMNKNNATHGLIKEQGRFSVSILNEDISPEIIRTLGFSSSRDTDKFSALPWEEEQGLPVLKKGCAGYLLCEVINSSDLGTHTVFFAKVQDAALAQSGRVMTYEYYHNVIKGNAPKNAPTYQAPEKTQEEGYICTVCGYFHKGELPPDFKCPVCGVPVEKFKKAPGKGSFFSARR